MDLGSVTKSQQWLANRMIAYLHGNAFIPESPTSDTLAILGNINSGDTPQSGSSTIQVMISVQDPPPPLPRGLLGTCPVT